MSEVAFDAATEGALFWLSSQPFAIGEKLIKRKLNTNAGGAGASIPEVQASAGGGVLETRQTGSI